MSTEHECPTCGAGPGSACLTSSGRSTDTHRARLALSDERYSKVVRGQSKAGPVARPSVATRVVPDHGALVLVYQRGGRGQLYRPADAEALAEELLRCARQCREGRVP